MVDLKAHLKLVFGDSSESEDEKQQLPSNDPMCSSESPLTIDHNQIWEPIKEINGLWLCREFLSPPQQSILLSAIQREGWFTEGSNNQAMRFGDLPSWALELSNSIREAVLSIDHEDASTDHCVLPSDLLWREPLFDQLIVNLYQPGEGICAHVDLLRFEDGIAIVSLESSCVMHFTKVDGEIGEEDPTISRFPVYLNPGSLVILWGESRYLWKHEINRNPGFQIWQDKELNQKRRTSITLRKLCSVE